MAERIGLKGKFILCTFELREVHKMNFPFRPILSAIGTHSYNLSKFLVSILNPLLNSPFMISDTFSFPGNLRSLNLDPKKNATVMKDKVS